MFAVYKSSSHHYSFVYIYFTAIHARKRNDVTLDHGRIKDDFPADASDQIAEANSADLIIRESDNDHDISAHNSVTSVPTLFAVEPEVSTVSGQTQIILPSYSVLARAARSASAFFMEMKVCSQNYKVALSLCISIWQISMPTWRFNEYCSFTKSNWNSMVQDPDHIWMNSSTAKGGVTIARAFTQPVIDVLQCYKHKWRPLAVAAGNGTRKFHNSDAFLLGHGGDTIHSDYMHSGQLMARFADLYLPRFPDITLNNTLIRRIQGSAAAYQLDTFKDQDTFHKSTGHATAIFNRHYRLSDARELAKKGIRLFQENML